MAYEPPKEKKYTPPGNPPEERSLKDIKEIVGEPTMPEGLYIIAPVSPEGEGIVVKKVTFFNRKNPGPDKCF